MGRGLRTGVKALAGLPQALAEINDRLAALESRAADGASGARDAEILAAIRDTGAQRQMTHARVPVYMGENVVLASTVWNTQMYLDTRDIGFTPHIIANGVWELANTKAFFRLVREGMTAVEVGANFGYFTLLGARLVGPSGRYHAFEPNASTFRCLQKSIVINGFREYTTLVNKAVSDFTGSTNLHLSTLYTTNTNIVEDHAVIGNLSDVFTTVEIEVTTLDEYFGETTPQIDFVKIDAEGSEPAIFRGMERILRSNERIQLLFEYAPMWIRTAEDPAQCLQYLTDLGFRLWRVDGAEGDLVQTSIPELQHFPFCEVYAARRLPDGVG